MTVLEQCNSACINAFNLEDFFLTSRRHLLKKCSLRVSDAVTSSHWEMVKLLWHLAISELFATVSKPHMVIKTNSVQNFERASCCIHLSNTNLEKKNLLELDGSDTEAENLEFGQKHLPYSLVLRLCVVFCVHLIKQFPFIQHPSPEWQQVNSHSSNVLLLKLVSLHTQK